MGSTGYHRRVGYEEIVESRIREALEAGQFSGLPGEGKPLPRRIEEDLAGENWIGFKILNDAGALPDWLLLARDIEECERRLSDIDREHLAVVEGARETGDWESRFPGIAQLRSEFERLARRLRAKQDRFNYEAPNLALERPGIWVERRLDALDSRISSPISPGH